MPSSARVVGLAGSLRTGSLNGRLLGAARELAPVDLTVTVFDGLAGVPLFNEDLEREAPDGPGTVAALRALVGGADGLLIATPEYNQSVPGVVKNVVDWLSRPDGASVLDGLPTALMGATTGAWGTRYAQKELRHALTAAGAIVMPQPMVFLAHAGPAFDATGSLVDVEVRRRVTRLVSAFRRWIALVSAPDATAGR